jgi:hypothetical protein
MNRKVELAIIGFAFAGALGLATPANAATWFVNSAVATSGNGTSWNLTGPTRSFKTLQEGIMAASSSAGDEVWVAPGNYSPGSTTASTFTMKENVAIIGGFTANLSNPSERNSNPLTNGTVLTGVFATGMGNVQVVVTGSNLPNTSLHTILDGFTITGGNGGSGAGISLGSGSSPTIKDCWLIGNTTASNGGAISVGGGLSSPVIEDCTFEDNSAAAGGAIVFAGTTSLAVPQITRCRFVGNVATGTTGGGAIFHNQNGSPGSFGNLRIRDCIFIANEARAGAGGAVVLQIMSHSEFTQCLFSRNRAFRSGGGIWCNSTAAGLESLTTLINCTFAGNAAMFPVGSPPTQGIGGGVRIESQFTVAVKNSIFWGNTANDSDLGKRQISYGLAPTVTYTSIQGYTSGLFPGTGNNGGDPKFVSAAMDNLRVTTGSAAIDAADRAAVPGVSEDLDGSGHARLLDDPNTANSGPGTPADWLDRGVFEFDRLRDCDNDGTQDNDEIAAGAPDCNDNGKPDDCEVPPLCASCADCNANGVPDSCDLANGTLYDCDGDGIPEGCAGEFTDCNHNCTDDATDIANCAANDPSCADCNNNSKLDVCEFEASKEYTGATFDEGVSINVSRDSSGLYRNATSSTAPLPYLWVSCSLPDSGQPPYRDSAVRINVDAVAGQEQAAVVGEYRTAPDIHIVNNNQSPASRNPSRSAVDLDGSVWIANRSDSVGGQGTLVKIGVHKGGTRVNADGTANANGQYLKPPFEYCTCEDRDGDALIKTSRGIGDILPWSNWNGADDVGAVSTAEDECIIRYVRVTGTGVRTVAIDKDNDVWVGTYGPPQRWHQRLDGFTGAVTPQPAPFNPACGGYGGLIDCNGGLWSASEGGLGPLRYNTIAQSVLGCLGSQYGDYGLGMDGATGFIWHTKASGNAVVRINPADLSFTTFAHSDNSDTGAQGVAVDRDGNVWVAHGKFGPSHSIGHLVTDGTLVGNVDLTASGGAGPTGVAVDRNGKIWVTNFTSNNVMRIDPNAGAIGGGGRPIGAVDLTIPLHVDGLPDGFPYNYSDMTGMVALQATGTGTWSVIHDGVIRSTSWCRLAWNNGDGCTLGGGPSDFTVSVRASDSPAALAAVPYTAAVNGQSFSSTVQGRFVQLRVRFMGPCPGVLPIVTPGLCDVTLFPKCLKGDVNLDGNTDGKDIQPLIERLLQGPACALAACQPDTNDDGAVTLADIPCFVAILLGNASCSQCRTQSVVNAQSETTDCNGNGVNDANDIAGGTSQDCNQNFIPDECDINTTDPDGDGKVSADVNGNGIPDECEPDCNGNLIPDAWDISNGGKADVDSDGVPDECEKDCNANGVPDDYDIAVHTSADCNQDGGPDECEQDCNGNGKPDDCDIDPTDPDGNGQTSPDCNQNQYPDECDLTLAPPLGSLDCNANGIPDECDIASGYSQDMNANNIPDECEGGQSAMAPSGGEGMGSGDGSAISDGDTANGEMMNTAQAGTGESPAPQDLGAAWEAYYEWAFDQCWGPDCPLTVQQQFQAYVDKLTELGLPVIGPRIVP